MLTSVELGSGSHNCIAENITETGIQAFSNAWRFVIKLIYLPISCTTVQTNQWQSPETIFSGKIPVDTKEVGIENNCLFRSF